MTLSLEKVEKVVKPPQNPVSNTSDRSDLKSWILIKHPLNIPISKQPSRLVIKVAHGKVTEGFVIPRVSKKRKHAPIPPPIKTSNNCLRIISGNNEYFDGKQNNYNNSYGYQYAKTTLEVIGLFRFIFLIRPYDNSNKNNYK